MSATLLVANNQEMYTLLYIKKMYTYKISQGEKIVRISFFLIL